MNGLGRAGAYLALFSEIGFVLLIATLAGVLAGYWVDRELRTVPVFALTGFFIGFASGGVGAYRLITRFLARFE